LNLFIFTDALCVSGGSSAHHQEHITVHTASGIVICNDRVKKVANKFVYKISGLNIHDKNLSASEIKSNRLKCLIS